MAQNNKGTRFLEEKVKEILLKRYALERIIDWWKLLLSFFLTILSIILFAFYWFAIVNVLSNSGKKVYLKILWKWILPSCCNDRFHMLLLVFLIGLFFFLMIGYFIWKIVGNVIPKFVFLGVVGWIIISGSMLPDLFVPGTFLANKYVEKNNIIGFPFCRYFSISEKKVRNKGLNKIKILDCFLSPFDYFKNNEKQKKDDKQLENSIVNLRLFLFFLFFIFLLDIFLVSSTYKKEKGLLLLNYFPWKKREFHIKIDIIFFNLFAILLYLFSENYFFLIFVFLLGFNFFLIKWEIEDNGQNHKTYSRAALFLFLISSFSVSFSEVFLILFLPIYVFISEKSFLLSEFDAITITWMVIVGSQIAVLFGMITQTVWSGKRLTEKFN